jgi:hypothetical protein
LIPYQNPESVTPSGLLSLRMPPFWRFRPDNRL